MNEPADAVVFACALPPAELRKRRAEILVDVRRKVVRIEETDDGFVLSFVRSTELASELEEFIRFEAACCAFVTMSLRESADGREIELRMRAPDGAKPFLRAEFIDLPDVRETTSCGCAPTS